MGTLFIYAVLFLKPRLFLLVFVLFCFFFFKYFAATLALKLQSYLKGVTFGILRGKIHSL